MKILFIIFFVNILVFNCQAQKKALYNLSFYFEDAAGNKDTIIFRADTAIIDNPSRSDDDWNPDWEEIIDNSPFDSIFEVRAKPKFEIAGDFYQNIILRAVDEEPKEGCIAPDPLLMFVYSKNWPVKMSWDQFYYRNHPCLYGSVGSPDSDYEQKWLFKDPVPIRPVACLGSSNSFTKDLRLEVLEKNFELPIVTEHFISGQGIQYISAIGIDFGPPYFHLCDTLTLTQDLESDQFLIYPTIAQNEITIISSNLNPKICTIFEINGITAMTSKFKENKFIMNIRTLVNGIYFLQIKNSNGTIITKKFAKT